MTKAEIVKEALDSLNKEQLKAIYDARERLHYMDVGLIVCKEIDFLSDEIEALKNESNSAEESLNESQRADAKTHNRMIRR